LPILHENCHLYGYKVRMECQSCATLLHNKRLKFEVHIRVVCTADMEEQGLLVVKDFTLQEVKNLTSWHRWWNANIFWYAIYDASAKLLSTKARGNEDMWVTNVDWVGRQNKATTVWGFESKDLCLRHSGLWG
jgi:hypothetical protein